LRTEMQRLQNLVDGLYKGRGPILGSGEPPENVAGRYPRDFYVDSESNQPYWWYPAVEDEPSHWEPMGTATESMPFRIEPAVADNGSFVLDPYQHYAVRIEALQGVSGATVAVSPAIGSVASVGEAISITLSGVPDPAVVVAGSILLRRV